jgi:hypothetical protein
MMKRVVFEHVLVITQPSLCILEQIKELLLEEIVNNPPVYVTIDKPSGCYCYGQTMEA